MIRVPRRQVIWISRVWGQDKKFSYGQRKKIGTDTDVQGVLSRNPASARHRLKSRQPSRMKPVTSAAEWRVHTIRRPRFGTPPPRRKRSVFPPRSFSMGCKKLQRSHGRTNAEPNSRRIISRKSPHWTELQIGKSNNPTRTENRSGFPSPHLVSKSVEPERFGFTAGQLDVTTAGEMLATRGSPSFWGGYRRQATCDPLEPRRIGCADEGKPDDGADALVNRCVPDVRPRHRCEPWMHLGGPRHVPDSFPNCLDYLGPTNSSNRVVGNIQSEWMRPQSPMSQTYRQSSCER